MKKSCLLISAAAALLLSSVRPANAQQKTGFALDRFEPSERGSQFFVNDTLDFRGSTRPALGVVFDYAYKPLVVYELNGEERTSLVRHSFMAHPGASVVFGERLRLGLNVPIAMYQDGDSSVVNGEALKGADKAAIGDVRIAADFRLAGEYRSPITVAAGVRAWLPTGQQSQFTGDGSVRLAPQLMASGGIDAFVYSARLALVYRARDEAYAGSAIGSELFGAIGAGLRVLDDKLVVGPELHATSVFTSGDAFFKTRGTPVEWLMGAHYDAGPVRIGAGVGSGLTRGYGSPEVRGLFSLEVVTPHENPDRDRDGILDESDACPDVAGVADPDPKKNGCPPPPPPDTDRDGVLDVQDACPTVPGIRTDDPATNGCPDRDKDGIVDAIDACPDVPGIKTEDPKKNGCPPDADGDGIIDAEDACRDVPGVRDPDPKKNGCPADTDGDGILDNDDACPKLPGPKNADPKKHGCPLVIVTEKEIRIGEQVKFKFNSAEILPESDTILSAVKKVFDEHVVIKKVRIEGHTDNVGKPPYNKALSRRRAASVMKWLTDHGIDKKRLISQGFGQEEPIDTNETDAGRANNRRVAFTILERDEKPKDPAIAPNPAPGSAPAPGPTTPAPPTR